jgi:hypothetical protein
MIDPRAIELAKSQGYRPHGNWQHMFCDFEFWKCLAKAVKYAGAPLELAQEFLPLIFAASHPVDLEGYHDEDHHLRIVWDDLVEPAEEEKPFAVVKPDVLYMCRYGANVSEESAERLHTRLRERLGDDIYALWLASLEFYSFNDGVLIATVPVKFLMRWINDHYLDDLVQVCGEEFDNLERVELVQRHPGMRGSP